MINGNTIIIKTITLSTANIAQLQQNRVFTSASNDELKVTAPMIDEFMFKTGSSFTIGCWVKRFLPFLFKRS